MLIPFTQLQQKYKFTPSGVVHVGAHEGQELSEYHKIGIEKMIFIEALPEIYTRLVKHCEPYPEILCFNECIGAEDGELITFHVANNDSQSSSFLDFGTHRQMHPEVEFINDLHLKTTRLDTLLNGLDKDYDFLNMDIQGAEGVALIGLGSLLDQFNYLYLEVNKTEVYKGCMQVDELDKFLFEFERVETLWPGRCTWGDAFYLRK